MILVFSSSPDSFSLCNSLHRNTEKANFLNDCFSLKAFACVTSFVALKIGHCRNWILIVYDLNHTMK